jgi:hypothetical protein
MTAFRYSEPRPYIVAFHGDTATGKMLREDMGNPMWVDEYWDGPRTHAGVLRAADYLSCFDCVALVAYSSGGSFAAKLSCQLTNIACAVLCESPIRGPTIPCGNFDVLSLWNGEHGRYDSDEARNTIADWRRNHVVQVEFTNIVGHMRREWWRWPRRTLRHNWDRSMNLFIYDWILKHGKLFQPAV